MLLRWLMCNPIGLPLVFDSLLRFQQSDRDLHYVRCGLTNMVNESASTFLMNRQPLTQRSPKKVDRLVKSLFEILREHNCDLPAGIFFFKRLSRDLTNKLAYFFLRRFPQPLCLPL